MSSGIKSAGSLLSAIFDPYVAGTTKASAANISDVGNDLSNQFANITYGSAAGATGIKTAGADLNTKYAKLGTATYALACNGTTVSADYTIPSGSTGGANCNFAATSTGWVLTKGEGPAATTLQTGSMPGGSSKIKYTMTPILTTSGASIVNDAASATALSGTALNYSTVIAVAGSSSGTRNCNYGIKIEIYNAGGSVISTTNMTFNTETDGSS